MSHPPGLTILVVEDESLLRSIVVQELSDAGYHVLETETGDAALGLLREGTPVDLLFTDIRLPGSADGWQVAKAFRQVSPTLPVIYATGYSPTQEPVDGSLFFRKPYRTAHLLQAIRALTNAP